MWKRTDNDSTKLHEPMPKQKLIIEAATIVLLLCLCFAVILLDLYFFK